MLYALFYCAWLKVRIIKIFLFISSLTLRKIKLLKITRIIVVSFFVFFWHFFKLLDWKIRRRMCTSSYVKKIINVHVVIVYVKYSQDQLLIKHFLILMSGGDTYSTRSIELFIIYRYVTFSLLVCFCVCTASELTSD